MRCGFATGVIFLSITIAQSAEQSKVVLASDPFNEVFREAAQISGSRLAGVVTFGAAADSDVALEVRAELPGDWGGSEACLTVQTADGLYESVNAYRISPDWAGGTALLEYPARRPYDLARAVPERLSALLAKGTCGQKADEFVPVQWGSQPNSRVHVLLNTARADEAFLFIPGLPALGESHCRPVEAVNRSAFDMTCVLPEAANELVSITVSVITFKNGEMGSESVFVIRPGGSNK